jgi:uncharacterized protein YggU (UPF0235/DUF167 family)
MKISIQVKTNSRIESVEQVETNSYFVRVRVPPIEGKANDRIRELLSEYFQKPKSQIKLLSGLKSKKKIFEIG